MDPNNLIQPAEPEKVVKWLALELAKEGRKTSERTDDEIMLIVLSDLLSRLVFFYRGTELLFRSCFEEERCAALHEKLTCEAATPLGNSEINFDTPRLYDIEMECGTKTNTHNLVAFRTEWGKRGAKEWEWKKRLSQDERKVIDTALETIKDDKKETFLNFLFAVADDDIMLLDSIFKAMHQLSFTVKWEKFSTKSRETLAQEYPKLVTHVKYLEGIVEEQRNAERERRGG